MIRLFFISLTFFLSSLSFASAPIASLQNHYDHVIIFGDSLSDIGNMPMSPALIEPSTHIIALNLYVPFSNPMALDGTYQVPLTDRFLDYPQPSPTLSPYMNVNGQVFARNYKSLNWAQFFVHQAQQDGLVTDQQTLVPWIWWKQYSNQVRSIDFAFAGATSQDNCRDFEYQHPNSDCNSDTVFNAQIPYRMAGISQNKTSDNPITQVQVPGVDRQVALFLEAVKQHPDLSTPNTLYIIFVGGNDLNLALYNLSQHHYLDAFGALLHGTSNNVSHAITLLQNQAGAKHIVVMNLFDMRLTPYLHTNLPMLDHLTPKQESHLLTLAHLSVSLYNHQLKRLVMHLNALAQESADPSTVIYFDTYSALLRMSQSAEFNQPSTLYQMCLKTVGTTPDYYTAQNTCGHDKENYLFWNGAHPSIYVGEYVGYQLEQQLKA
jgi:phospholipase/lecithinase/hemolysin